MKRAWIFWLALAWFLVLPGSAAAQMTFHLDLGQDGSYEDTWAPRVGEEVTAGIYVSGIPDPGLVSMGFVLAYDDLKLHVVSAAVDDGSWSVRGVDQSTLGRVDFTGFRMTPGVAGDDILLAVVTLRCLAEGESVLRIQDRAILEPPSDPDGFVLADGTVLDGDIPGGGIVLASVGLPSACTWDLDTDGDVDGLDLAHLAQGPPATADVGPFAPEFGRNDCFD